jgi:hypothetical protein
MKYSSMNLNEEGITLPLRFPIKLIVEYRPNGVLLDYASMFYSADPEGATDKIVRTKQWDQIPGFKPSDVWVDGAF